MSARVTEENLRYWIRLVLECSDEQEDELGFDEFADVWMAMVQGECELQVGYRIGGSVLMAGVSRPTLQPHRRHHERRRIMTSYYEHYNEALQDEWFEQLYEEHAQLALSEFRTERLRSYYSSHPDIALPAVDSVSDARVLRSISPTASLIRATTGTELGIKNLLLRPIVYGLVHSESLAGAITEMVMGHQSLDRYRDLLIGILSEHGGIDLKTFKRPGATRPLLEEVLRNQKVNRPGFSGDSVS